MLKLAPCGVDCNLCPRYLASEDDSPERLKEIAADWRMVGWGSLEETLEVIACRGCASIEKCGLVSKACTAARQIDNCGECAEYPCEKMEEIFARNVREIEISRKNFSEPERDAYQRAFWDKKKRLDEIHRKMFGEIV